MTAEPTPVGPKPARRLRRALGLLVWGLAGLGVLLLVAWLGRQWLLVPWLRPRLEATLAQALGARRVRIGTLEGNWLTGLEVGGIAVDAGTSPRVSIDGARITARYSPLALMRGDLAGLHSATVTIDAADLDLRPASERAPAAVGSGAAFDPRSCEPLLRLLPEGARVRVARLRLLAPQGERIGPLELELRPGTGGRELSVAFAGVELGARLAAASTTGQPWLAVRVDAADPGALLDLFDLGAGARGGSLHAEVDVEASPWRLEARIDLRGLVHGDQRLAASHLEARLDSNGLAVARASIDVPGVHADLRDVRVPGVFGGGVAALREGLAGQFALRLDDLSPHAALLPAAWQPLLPMRGELRGKVGEGQLRLEPCALQARGVQLQIERGAFPLASEDWQAAEGSLRGTLAFDGFAMELPGLGATTANGRLAVTVAGSARAPQLTAELELGSCGCAFGSLAAAQGTLRYEADAVRAEGLRLQGVRAVGLASDAPVRVAFDGSCRLRQGAVDPDSLQAQVELQSELLADLLAPVFAEAGLGPPPAGESTLQFAARHTAEGLVVASVRFVTAPSSPVQANLEGQGVLPVRWSGTALQASAGGDFVLRLRFHRPAVEAVPALSLQGALHVEAGRTSLRDLVLTVGQASLRGELEAGQGLAALLDPAVDFAATSLRGELALAAIDLASLPAGWFGDREVRGELTGTVRAAGSAGRLSPELHLSLANGSLRGDAVPTVDAATLRLDVGPGEGASPSVVLAATIAGELAQCEPQRELAVTLQVRCDDSGTVLAPTTLRFGGGEVALELASSLRLADLLALPGSAAALGAATLTGTIALRTFSLAQLPAMLQSEALLRGEVDGEVVLDGRVADAAGPGILSRASLRLRDGEGKFGNLPRLERLAGEVALTHRELTLRTVTGTLGAGRFELRGRVRAKAASFAESWADAAVDLHLTGDDVLLYRADGAKVRASVDVAAAGTPAAIAVTGEIKLGRGSKYVRRLSLLPDFSARGGLTAQEGLRLFEVPAPLGDRVTFDVALQTREAFEVRTYVVDGEVDVAARLRGTAAAPRLEGNLSMRGGTLRFPGANLRIGSGLLTFSANEPQFPRLLLQAEGKRMGIVVTMTVTGRYDQPQVQLSSVPPLPPQDLLVLLTTGQLPSTLAGSGGEAQARVVGGYLAKEIFESYFGSDSTETSGGAFDRLTIETGREVSKNGAESVLIEYELLPDFAVQAERDQYEDFNLGLVLRFRFR